MMAPVYAFSQADLLMTVTYKMADAPGDYDQMPSPKWVLSVGACIVGGMYRICGAGIDQILPVDVYISGCPALPKRC